MKKLLSRISKKSVALLVAVALVLTSVASIVVASADTSERYTVTAKDPVVPMTAGYSVNLADFDVVDAAANTLEWSTTAAADKLVIDNEAGVIKAYERGVYKATAGDMTVYIVVKAPNETEYVLYENDYRDYTADEVSDWNTVFTKYSGKVIGSMAGADNRVSANLYDVEAEMAINPRLYGNDVATATTKLNYFGMTNGFLPYNPDTLFWYDTTVANGGEVTVNSSNLVSLRINHPEVGYGSVYNDPQYGCFNYGHAMYAVTVLDNEAISAFQNYKVTATMRMRTGNNGSVGIAGRISTDGKGFAVKDTFPLTTMTTVGFNKGNETGFALYNKITADENGLMSATVDSSTSNFTRYELDGGLAQTLYSTLYTNTNTSIANAYVERVYEYDFNGTALTVSSPDIPDTETDSASITFNAKEGAGNIGFFTRITRQDIITDQGKTGNIIGVPCVLDIKVTLNDSVDASLLPTTKMDGVNAAEKVFGTEPYAGNDTNWSVNETANGWQIARIKANDDAAAYPRNIVLPDYWLDGTTKRYTRSLASHLFRNLQTEGKTPRVGYKMANNVAEVTVPTFLAEFSDSVLYQMPFLEKVNNLDGHLEDLGEAAFSSTGVTELIFGDNLYRVGKYAFAESRSLKKIDLGNRLIYLNNNAFENCTLLSSIELPASLTTIGTNVFKGCTSLANVYVYNPELNVSNCGIPTTTTIHAKAGSVAYTTAQEADYNVVAIADAIADKAVSDYQNQEEQFTIVKVPAMANIDLSKLTYKADYAPVHNTMQSTFDLAGVYVKGTDNVTFADVTAEGYSIANGILTTGEASEETISITGTYTGASAHKSCSVPVTIQIVDEADTNLLDGQYEIIPETIPDFNIEPSATAENTYIINLTSDKTLIPNSIKVIDGDDVFPVFSLADTTGKAFEYLALREKATVTAEFTTENIEDDVFYLGSSIRHASDAKGAALKFMNRLPAIKYDGENITSDTIILDDGTTATVKAIGTLVIPSILLRDAELKIPANAEQTFNADTQEVVLGKLNGQSALNIKHKTVTAYSEDFSDVNAILGGLADLGLDEQQYKALQFSAVTYIQYTKADETVGYSYGDVQEKSYAEIEAAMYPEYVKGTTELDAILEGGTENDFVNTSAVNSFSYSLNEDITFKLRVKGNYKINYVLMKDNPSENLYGNESVLDASTLSYLNATNRYNSNCVVASGQFDDRIFTITTQMKQPGTVRLMVEIIGKNGEVVETANLSALADYKNITAAYDESFYVDDATVKAMYDTLRNNVDTFVANTLAPAIVANSTQITDFITAQLTNPQIGAEYTLTHNDVDLMYLQTVYTGNKAVSFNYRIATNAIVGIKANDANHLFDISEGGTYDVASDATGLPTYNLRPSSGYIAIPKDVTTGAKYGILGRYQGYGGYYWNPAYSSSSVIEVGTNGTGVINSYVKNGVIDEATKNTASSALGAKTPVNGGNNNFIFDSSKTEFEDPTQLFQYGMLIRNYTALKVVELLPFFDETKDVTMRGGSMGAWQSTSMAALYTKVNVLDIDKVWMCSIGVTEAGMLKSEFNPKASKASYYFTTINAAKQIGNREGFEATIEGYLGDYTSPPAGLAALYNVLVCKKSLTFNQYKNHSVQPPLGSGTKATATVSAAAQ